VEDNFLYIKEEKRFDKASNVLPPNKKQDGGLGEIIRFAILAIAIVLPIRIFIAQPFIVSGTSMVPTFENGEYIIVDQLSYRVGDIERGDVVIFKFPADTSKFFIKRIIGLPGETVTINGTRVFVQTQNGQIELDEPYIEREGLENTSVSLSNDEYFVMGDNRASSYDSRFWGPLSRDYIVGRALIRLLPVNKLDLFPGVHQY
jgi:signal peptidase I